MKKYMRCKRCVMDTTAADIVFDINGFCNFCSDFIRKILLQENNGLYNSNNLIALLKDIKKKSSHSDYDCIIGISG